jgi:hypothetical protein
MPGRSPSLVVMNYGNSGSDIPDPEFSRLRALDLPPEATVSRGIRDGLAQFDERFPNRFAKAASVSVAVPRLALWGVMQLELELIKLRHEVRRLRGE